MAEPFIGSEAIAHGDLTKNQLNTRYARLFRDVYIHPDAEMTGVLRAKAGWLWAGRHGVIAGFSAAALHGSNWGDERAVVEMIHDNRHRIPGIQAHGDRINEDEIEVVDGVPVTSPVRTALDLGCWYPTMAAVAGIDALARATELKAADIELLAGRYTGRRGIAGPPSDRSLRCWRSISERVLATGCPDSGRAAPATDPDCGVRRFR